MLRPRPIARAAAASAVGGLLLASVAPAAHAHVTAVAEDPAAGSTALVTFAIPHSCDGEATTSLRIEIPEGIYSVTPTRHALYDVEKTTVTLDEPVMDSHGNEIVEKVTSVRYDAKSPLEEGLRDEFQLSMDLPAELAGETVHFSTLQGCGDAEIAWDEVAADGEDPHALEAPAPSLTVGEAVDGHGDHGTHSDAHAEHSDEHAGHDDEHAEHAGGVSANAMSIAALILGGLGLLSGGIAITRAGRSHGGSLESASEQE